MNLWQNLLWHPHNAVAVQHRDAEAFINTTDLFTGSQEIALQVVSCVMGSISLLGALISLFWFIRMRRKFRHILIMLLICADILRSLNFVIFPLISLTHGHISSSSSYCQISGFSTQYGVEMADFVVLFIAIHTALQIFKPALQDIDEGGLHRYRSVVYVIIATLPAIISSIAFAQTSDAYRSQGPLCSLPLRPIWYRLAAWIPRYMIMMTIIGLYIAIAIHVRKQFGRTKPRWQSRNKCSSWRDRQVSLNFDNWYDSSGSSDSDHASHLPALDRKRNPTLAEFLNETSQAVETGADSFSDFRFTKSDANGSILYESVSSMSFQTVPENLNIKIPDSALLKSNDGSAAIDFSPPSANLCGKILLTSDMKKKRRHIQRQLWLLLIYPAAYFIMWLLPFVSHLFYYDDKFVQQPIFSLNLLAIFSFTSMGAVDSLIFTLREKPWRWIPSSDRTFSSSLSFWRRMNRSNSGLDNSSQSLASVKESSGISEESHGSYEVSFRNSWQSLSNVSPQASGRRHGSITLGESDNTKFRACEDVSPMTIPTTLDAQKERKRRDSIASASSADYRTQNANASMDWYDRRLSMAVGQLGSGRDDI